MFFAELLVKIHLLRILGLANIQRWTLNRQNFWLFQESVGSDDFYSRIRLAGDFPLYDFLNVRALKSKESKIYVAPRGFAQS